jgi:hypothetical protein
MRRRDGRNDAPRGRRAADTARRSVLLRQQLPDWKTLMSDGTHPKPGLYRLRAEQDFFQVADPLVRRLLDGTP